jgi:hypothetical protein
VAILRHFLTRTRVQFAAETSCPRYFGASDDENLSAGISWFTFLLQSNEQRRVQREFARMSARESYFLGQVFQNPSSVRCPVQSAGSREALRINVLALSCRGWRPLTIAVVMSGASQGSRRSM